MERFRFDQYGSVYEWDQANNCYLFCGKLNGQTQQEFINSYDA